MRIVGLEQSALERILLLLANVPRSFVENPISIYAVSRKTANKLCTIGQSFDHLCRQAISISPHGFGVYLVEVFFPGSHITTITNACLAYSTSGTFDAQLFISQSALQIP